MKLFKQKGSTSHDFLEADFFITLSLKDAVDPEKSNLLQAQFNLEDDPDKVTATNHLQKKYFIAYDQLLNNNKMGCLHEEGTAEKITETLTEFEGGLYHILAYTIMPNHIHLLIRLKKADQINPEQQLSDTLTLLKEQLNMNTAWLSKKGNPWQNDILALQLFKDQEYVNLISYLVEDAVKARLVNYWKDYRHTYLNSELMYTAFFG